MPNKVSVSQIALPKATNDLVYATAGYKQSIRNAAQVTLTSDMVFSDGASLELATINGEVSSGLRATLSVAVSSLHGRGERFYCRRRPGGLFYLNWRARTRNSTLSGEWRLNWYVNFHNTRGLAFHEFELPGVPASHACVRLLARDAEWVFNWGQSWTLDAGGQLLTNGTPVLILGAYAFESPGPWLSIDRTPTIALPATLPVAK